MHTNPLALQLTLPTIVNNVLERQYLSNADVLESFLQPDYQNITTGMREMLTLTKLQRLGVTQEGGSEQVSLAMRHALTGCYYPGVFQLCFLIESDGREISAHMGVRTPTCVHLGDSDAYLSNFTSVFQAECPGTRFSNEEPQSYTKRKFFAPITGVPSSLSSSKGNIEAFFAGMDGSPFSLMVVADPMPSSQIEQALFSCREMLSQAETFKILTQSSSNSYTEQVTRQIAKTLSDTRSVSNSSSSKGKTGALAVTAGVIATALIAPEIAPLVLMGGGMLLPNYTNGVSDSHTESIANTYGEAITTGVTSGQSVNIVNSHIAEASEYLKKFSSRLSEGKVYGAWNTSVYLMTDSKTAMEKGGMLIRALFTGDESYIEPIRIHPIVMQKSDCNKVRDGLSIFSIPHWNIVSPETKTRQVHPLGEAFSSLSTPLTSKELVRWLCLPTKDMPGLPLVVHAQGFSVNTPSSVKEDAIQLGVNNVQNGITPTQYSISPDLLTRHTLVAGMTRSGKTNTCKQILQELIQIKGGSFPFMIIEPAKTEYVDWALELNEKSPQTINVFMPGRKFYKGRLLSQLKINPFEVVWENDRSEPGVSEHIQHLTAIINASLPMQESLPLLMEEAIYNCYAEETFLKDATRKDSDICQWITDGTLTKPAPWGTPFPTFKTLMKLAPKVVERKKYHSEANSGLMAALNTRIGSFLHPGLPKCDSFLTDGKPVKGFWKSFFSKPTVINLSSIVGEEDKSFFMAILLMFLYEYRRQENDLYSNELRHLLVIEEAHNILRRAKTQGMTSIDSVGKASRMFSDFISEISAYGQGIMIVDQSPEKLSTDAIKNTNLKIVHRLSYGADRQQMAIAMDLSATQERIIPNLHCGEAIVRTDEDDKPAWLRINRCTTND